MRISTLASPAAVVTVGVNALTQPTSASPYAPVSALCPSDALLRPAAGLSSDESSFVAARKAVADTALAAWLAKTDSGFSTDAVTLPTIGLTTSGGGYRSLLLGAGVIQALDERDSDGSASGLFQALTYQAGLSGGSWLLSSFAGNNYPPITTLKESLWKPAFQASLLVPDNLLVFNSYGDIVDDLAAKKTQGFPPTLTDPWGRLLSYQLLSGPDGGANITLSSVASLSNFTSHAVPYPIITALGVKTFDGECAPGPNATTYEFTPFEFGSWDSDVSAFVSTRYLGTTLSNGQPTDSAMCIEKYDNLGYILGTSSTLFNELCITIPDITNSTTSINNDLAALLDRVQEVTTRDLYAVYPNPFYNYTSTTSIPNSQNLLSAQVDLSLVDGGEALQNNPIFPMLQPARNISVLLVNDNSADTSNNFPNGSEILTTYIQTFNHNLTRMPFIPSVETFVAKGLHQRATFFGCNETDKITIVYLPNFNFTFASNVSTSQLQYSEEETDDMVANGVAMMEQGSEDGWGVCLGCGIRSKAGGTLPAACTACFEKHCYYE